MTPLTSTSIAPMLAKLVRELPEGEGLCYEPKWDGFRCIVFRDGDEVVARQPQREAARSVLPRAVRSPAGESSRPLRARRRDRHRRTRPASTSTPSPRRIHPAASRVKLLAGTTPASFVAFDLLALGDARSHGCALRRTSRRAGAGAPPARAAHLPHAGDQGSGDRPRLVLTIRRRGIRRGDGEAR